MLARLEPVCGVIGGFCLSSESSCQHATVYDCALNRAVDVAQCAVVDCIANVCSVRHRACDAVHDMPPNELAVSVQGSILAFDCDAANAIGHNDVRGIAEGLARYLACDVDNRLVAFVGGSAVGRSLRFRDVRTMSAFPPIATKSQTRRQQPRDTATTDAPIRALRTPSGPRWTNLASTSLELAGNLPLYGVAAFVSGARRKGPLICHNGTRGFVQAQQVPADRLVARATTADLPNSHDGLPSLVSPTAWTSTGRE